MCSMNAWECPPLCWGPDTVALILSLVPEEGAVSGEATEEAPASVVSPTTGHNNGHAVAVSEGVTQRARQVRPTVHTDTERRSGAPATSGGVMADTCPRVEGVTATHLPARNQFYRQAEPAQGFGQA